MSILDSKSERTMTRKFQNYIFFSHSIVFMCLKHQCDRMSVCMYIHRETDPIMCSLLYVYVYTSNKKKDTFQLHSVLIGTLLIESTNNKTLTNTL